MQDWVVRNENGIGVVHIDGIDYVEVDGTTEDWTSQYPDYVKNQIIERKGDNIKVVLGPVRFILTEVSGVRQQPAKPQSVWLTPYNK